MVELKLEYKGDLRTEVVHVPSGAIIDTVAPRDNGGMGDRFSPTDIMAASVGACALTIMGKLAQRHGLDIKGSRVRVEKHMRVSPRMIERLVLDFELPALLSPNERTMIERAVDDCPARRSLNPDVIIESKFAYI